MLQIGQSGYQLSIAGRSRLAWVLNQSGCNLKRFLKIENAAFVAEVISACGGEESKPEASISWNA